MISERQPKPPPLRASATPETRRQQREWWAGNLERRLARLERARAKIADGKVRGIAVGVPFPSLVDDEGRARCAWCSSPLRDRARRYCGEKCRDEVWIRCNPGHARHKLHERDQGVCAGCGIDTLAMRRAGDRVRRKLGAMNWETSRVLQDRLRTALAKSIVGPWGPRLFAGRYTTHHLWEMDHIVAVVDGGGLCGLDNLQTLCIPCHRLETARLASRRADERQGQMPLYG